MTKRRRRSNKKPLPKRSKLSADSAGDEGEEAPAVEISEESTSSSIDEVQVSEHPGIINPSEETETPTVPPGVIQEAPVPEKTSEPEDSGSEVLSIRTPSPQTLTKISDQVLREKDYLPAKKTSSETGTIPEEIRIEEPQDEESEIQVLVSNCEAEAVPKEQDIPGEGVKKSLDDSEPKSSEKSNENDSPGSEIINNKSASETVDILATAFAQVFDHRPLLLPQKSSAVPIETVKGIARETGRSKFSPEALAYIAMDATFAIKLLLQESNKFREASKRRDLKCADIDRSLKLLAAKQPLFGLALPSHLKAWLREETSGLVFEKDQILTPELLEADLRSLRIPRGPSVVSHWLLTADSLDLLSWPEDFEVEELCFYEAEEDYDILEESTVPETEPEAPKNPSQVFESLAKRRPSFVCSERIHLRSQSTGLLTKELESYFLSLTGAFLGLSEERRNIALGTLELDPNMIYLLGSLVNYMIEQTEHYLAHPEMKKLQILMTMMKQLMLNEYIGANQMKQYLHLILPVVMSCIVCSTVSSNSDYEHHWTLRNYSTDLLKFICEKYSSDINGIQGRVLKELKRGLRRPGRKNATGTIYGILYALKAFGPQGFGSEMDYLERVVKKEADIVLASPITVDSSDRTNSVKIKDLIGQMKQMIETNKAAPKIPPKIKTRILSKDHVPRFENSGRDPNSRPQPLITRKPKKPAPPLKPPPPVKAAPAPAPPAGPRPMPIPRLTSLGPSSKSAGSAGSDIPALPDPIIVPSVTVPTIKAVAAEATVSQIAGSPPPVFVHPSKIFHTYTFRTAPKPRPLQQIPRPRPRPLKPQPPRPRLSPAATPFPFPRIPAAPRLRMTRTPLPRPRATIPNNTSSPGASSAPGQGRQYFLLPVEKDSGVPSLEAINSLLQGQVPLSASIITPQEVFSRTADDLQNSIPASGPNLPGDPNSSSSLPKDPAGNVI